ncbi:chromate transporter [Deinococcus peraridilitoris]|uniref:Chromate transport protein ChrA n=1 Tax=Deinococcus peraridilitoris (strain DSM 19664 / LMG 22246 / CIP 109416 / KR-200) TaxID=937777 RepID=L0A6V9_DEIPD|nr:chromate transporter [Deinococcus peraridilitoris]AFZ69571.1 chromate transport protein ChrA [Deinococcus peraridilitoris DSM 19664]
MSELLELLLVFARLGLLSVGAAFAVLPEMARQLTEVHDWLTPREFTDGYALGQLAPGPNMLAVFFYGHRVAGLPGALMAGLGMFGPPLLIALSVTRLWSSVSHTPWAQAARRALVPVGAGLMASGVLTLSRGALHDAFTLALAVVALLVLYRWRVNPALVVVIGGLLGALHALLAA